MEKFNLRDSGPFTSEQAAARLKLASRQLKWFTLCHPYWASAHCSYQWKTAFPLPSLALPKRVRMTTLNSLEGKFSISGSGEDQLAAALKAGAKLAGLADCFIWLYRRSARAKPGLNSFRIELTPQGDWMIEAEVYHAAAKAKGKMLKLAIETGQLMSLTGWKLTKSNAAYGKNSCMSSELSLKLPGRELRRWLPSFKGILNASQGTFRQASWHVSLNYNFVEDNTWWKGSRCIWKRTDGKQLGSKGKSPEELLNFVNTAGFPSGQAEVGFECTVDRLGDFLGLFKLATICEPGLDQAIGIFETERGKQGFLMFRSERKGIKLIVSYGQNGWEDLHQELRKTNGNVTFSSKPQT